MSWRWTKKTYKDKRFPSSSYLTCGPASKKFTMDAICRAKIFQFAEVMGTKTKIVDPRKKSGETKIKVTELGRGLELPDDYVPFRSYDPEDIIQKTLIRQMKLTLDRTSAMVLKQKALDITTSSNTLKKLIPGAKWNDTEALCGIISGYMSSCITPYTRNHYIGIGGIKFLLAVKNHPKFLMWKKYLKDGDILFLEEVGATPNIRWIECLDLKAFSKNEAVVFGNKGLLVKEVQPLELRIYERIIAWYEVLGFVGQNVLHIPERRDRWT